MSAPVAMIAQEIQIHITSGLMKTLMRATPLGSTPSSTA
jgi:hypothetical protein